MTIRMEATGHSDYVPEDRPAIFATLQPGATDVVEIRLTVVIPEGLDAGDAEPIREIALGQYRLKDFVAVVSEASQKVLELERKYPESNRGFELISKPTGLEL